METPQSFGAASGPRVCGITDGCPSLFYCGQCQPLAYTSKKEVAQAVGLNLVPGPSHLCDAWGVRTHQVPVSP